MLCLLGEVLPFQVLQDIRIKAIPVHPLAKDTTEQWTPYSDIVIYTTILERLGSNMYIYATSFFLLSSLAHSHANSPSPTTPQTIPATAVQIVTYYEPVSTLPPLEDDYVSVGHLELRQAAAAGAVAAQPAAGAAAGAAGAAGAAAGGPAVGVGGAGAVPAAAQPGQ